MSYLETLQSHNTRLSALIDTANSLPEAGDGGGGSVETTTLTINNYMDYSNVVVVADLSGSPYGEAYIDMCYNNYTLTIENVVIGSLVSIHVTDQSAMANTTTNCEVVNGFAGFVKAFFITDENPVIACYSDDMPG